LGLSALPLNRTSVIRMGGCALNRLADFGVAGAFGMADLARSGPLSSLFSSQYLPHRYCYLAQPGLVWTNALSDGLIAISYVSLFGCLFWLASKVRHAAVLHPYVWIFIGFGSFILACGVTHGMEIVTIWWPVYPLAAAFKVVCAAISVSTAVVFAKVTPSLAGNILSVIDSLAQERQETENEAVNYQGQIEAISRSQMMVELDMDGTIIKANDNYLRAFGYQGVELAGKYHDIFVGEESRHSPEYAEFWKELRAGHYQAGLFRRIDKQGNTVWIEASYNPILGPDGIPTKVVKFASNVTERIQIQNDLKDAEARLQAILDNVLDGIITIDDAGIIASINSAAVKMFGYEVGDVVGHNVKMLMPEPDRSAHDSHLAAYRPGALTRAIGVGRELEGLNSGGGVFPMELTVTDFAFRNQRMFVGLVRDISARKKQEQAHRRTREVLDRTGRIAQVGGWEIDLITTELTWSEEALRLVGLPSDYRPTLEEGIHQLFAPDAQAVIKGAIEKAIAEHGGFAVDLPLTRADGRPIWVRVTGSVECEEGKPVRMVGATQDVSERVAEQAALQEANERASLAAEYSGVGIWSWDLSTNLTTWNSWMYRHYGMTEGNDRLAGHEIQASRIHRDDRRSVEQALRDCIDGIKPFDMMFRVVWDDRSVHHLRSAGQTKHDEKGKPLRMVGTDWDVTELVKANETSWRALQIAQDSNRTKSDFLANMSHEIRTPMNAILGITYLARRANPGRKQLDYLTKIGNAAESLLGIMNDILDFSKIEAGKLELEVISFSLTDILRNLLDVVGQKAEDKGVALVISVSADVPTQLVGDPLRLGQILINLVNNAIKFTDAGEITVRVEADEISSNDLRLNILVADTGIGMSPEQVANLFQSFHQGDTSFTRKYGGTGLGLAICKRLCELMKGQITVQSELGKGSDFRFTARFGIATNMALWPPAGADDQQQKYILIVDDSQNTRHSLVAMLDGSGYQAKAVSSGEEALTALARASQSGRPIDLVLMDWRLPGINGIEASRRIKANPTFSRIPEILMVSAFEREEILTGHSDVIFDGFLSKPVSRRNLLDAIAAVLGSHAAPGEPVPAAVATTTGAPELVGRRVLLVEDNEVNRFLAIELLNDLGIDVSIASNGRECVDRVHAEPFDVVLMDIQMPVMDGLTATKLLRAESRFQSLPIVAMTAHAMGGDRERSLEAGMNDHLTKPINPQVLMETLVRWMPAKPIGQPVIEKEQRPAVSSSEEVPEHLPPFDIPAALARANGKPGLLRKMLLSFHGQYKSAAAELRRQIAEGKTEEASRLAHTLKGVAATLEAKELASTAANIEHALREGLMDGLEGLINTMESALEPAIAAAGTLDRRVARPSPATPPEKTDMCILLVDDQSTYLDLLNDAFGSHTELLYARDGLTALKLAAARVPDLILLDVIMAGIDGYEVFNRLKANAITSDIPVIFLTGLGSVAEETKGLAMGACDYVTKPINPVAVRTRVTHQVELKRAHDQLTRMTEEEHAAELAQEAERAAEVVRASQEALQLKDEFLSNVSHELRSPLTSIYSFSSIIADGLAGATNEQQDEYLGIIQRNVRQLQSMIEDLLAVTAGRTGKLIIQPQDASVSEAILDAVHTTEANATAKGIKLSYVIPPKLPRAFADPVRILQVLTILCDNATKFTPAGGLVKVEAKVFEKVPGYLVVEVSDTGCGIRPEQVGRIFEYLYQVTESSQLGRKGLGLGLHIAKELVTRQGGSIWATSTPGSSSVFSFTLPIYAGQRANMPLPAASAAASSTDGTQP
jgi:two-component system, sensor histidine kinase and response regulator